MFKRIAIILEAWNSCIHMIPDFSVFFFFDMEFAFRY
jgi:hypothetical protein